jgi:hypothetical protein
MKHLLILPLLLAAACGGGLDTHEGVMEAHIDVVNDMADVLKTIKDKSSAEAAKPKLEKLAQRGKEIETAMSKIEGEPDEKLMEKMSGDLSKAMSNLTSAMMGLPDDPEVRRIIGDIDLGR